jgi:hypothetical protein
MGTVPEKMAGPVQDASAGSNSSKVKAPVGSKPPERFAASLIGCPTRAEEAAADSSGVARFTVEVASPQTPSTGKLLASPE